MLKREDIQQKCHRSTQRRKATKLLTFLYVEMLANVTYQKENLFSECPQSMIRKN